MPSAPRSAGRADPWQPPLTAWGHVWRMALALSISAIVWLPTGDVQTGRPAGLILLDLGLGLVAFGLVALRRRHPMPVAVALALMSALSGTAAGPATLAAVSLATHRRYAQVLVVGALTLAAAQVWVLLTPASAQEPWWLTLSLNTAFTIAVIVFGMYIGSRRELLWTLRERATRAETEQALRVEQARATERERIAREMHDVLGHRISLVGMHAGALAYRDDLAREEVASSARVIEDNARLAMSELRSVLGVLRSGDPAPDQPAPALTDVASLVEEAVASGMRVELAWEVDEAASAPTGVGRTAYRVVQEGLTNVRKHAPGARARVSLSGSPGAGLVVRVENPQSLDRSALRDHQGYGIVGLSERAALAGGRLTTQRDRHRFALEVWLPW